MALSGDPSIIDNIEEYLPILKFMLEHKANIEAKDDNGMFLTYILPS